MLKVALAGLVLNNVMSLAEAEYINNCLIEEDIPDTVEGVIHLIEEMRAQYQAN